MSSKAERIRRSEMPPVLRLLEPAIEETLLPVPSPPSSVPVATMPAQLLQKGRGKKTKAPVSAVTDCLEAQPKICISSVPPPAVLDGPVSPSPTRLRICFGDEILSSRYVESHSVKVNSLFVESSFYYEESEVPLEGSSTDEISSTKVFGGGPKPGVAVGGCHGYNPTGAPPVMVNSVRRVASVPNSERVKIKPPTISPVEVDDIVPSKSLSVFPTPIYFRRRRAPRYFSTLICELPTTRRKLSQNYFCDFGWSSHSERELNFCACGTSEYWADFYHEDYSGYVRPRRCLVCNRFQSNHPNSDHNHGPFNPNMRGPDHMQCDCLSDDSWVPILETGEDGIPIVCLLCDLQQKWERKRDRLEARLIREEQEAESVGVASSDVITASSDTSAADWAISQPILLPVVVQPIPPVQVVVAVHWPPIFEYTAHGLVQLPWERADRSGRGHDFHIDNVDDVIPPDAHGQAQLFENHAADDNAELVLNVIPPVVLAPAAEPVIAPARPIGTPRVPPTPTRLLLSQVNRNRYWQRLMQGTPTVDAIRRQRERRSEAIAKAKALESTSRVRAALDATIDPVQQTPAPVLIVSPNFEQVIAPVTGVINNLGPLSDSGLVGDTSLFRPQVDRFGTRSALDITAHTTMMRQRRFDAQAQVDLDATLDTNPKRRRYAADASKINIAKFSGFTCSDVPKWIDNYTRQCRAQSINKARAFTLHCTEAIYARLEGCPTFPNLDLDFPIDPWNAIELLLLDKYFIPQDRPTRHAEFTDCVMKSDETVGEFFDRLDALAYNCGGTNAEIWTVFYRGLIPVVRDKLPIP